MGIILYEMITRHTPFDDTSESALNFNVKDIQDRRRTVFQKILDGGKLEV